MPRRAHSRPNRVASRAGSRVASQTRGRTGERARERPRSRARHASSHRPSRGALLFRPVGLLVWAPVVTTVLLLAGASDASRGLGADSDEPLKVLFYVLGSAIGFEGIVLGGCLATAVGALLFLALTPNR